MNNYSGKLVFLSLLVGGLVSGCSQGDTDGGKASDVDFGGTQYVASDGRAGTITLTVVDDELRVSEISGFFVEVRDELGNPVPNVQVACDTEVGLVLLEPTRGFELTGEDGRMSAKLGCEAPGSLQIVCRLPRGGNFRKFHTIKCNGPVPTGFQGFGDDVGGGGLGGGVSVNDDGGIGGTDSDGVRITAIAFNDEGEVGDVEAGTTAIDVLQDTDCDNDPTTADPEPFFDTHIAVKIVNNTNQNINFTHFRYALSDADGDGSDFRSASIGLVGDLSSGVPADGGEATYSAVVFDAHPDNVNGTNTNGKRFKGSRETIPSNLGIRTVRVTLFGKNSLGESVQVTANVALSFDNFSRC